MNRRRTTDLAMRLSTILAIVALLLVAATPLTHGDGFWTDRIFAPSVRSSHAMAYIGGDQVLLFGGRYLRSFRFPQQFPFQCINQTNASIAAVVSQVKVVIAELHFGVQDVALSVPEKSQAASSFTLVDLVQPQCFGVCVSEAVPVIGYQRIPPQRERTMADQVMPVQVIEPALVIV